MGLRTNKASISHYETDKRKPELLLLEAFADYFEVSIDFLLGRTELRKFDSLEKEFPIEDWTEEELKEIEWFKALLKAKRKK